MRNNILLRLDSSPRVWEQLLAGSRRIIYALSIAAALLLAFAACESDAQRIRATNEAAATPAAERTPISAEIDTTDIQDGDCINSTLTEGVSIESVVIVTCSGNWQYRALNSFALARSGSFPGEAFIIREANKRCDRRYTDLLYPEAESWSYGDRKVTCLQESFGLSATDRTKLDRLVDIDFLAVGDCFNEAPETGDLLVELVDCFGDWEFQIADIFSVSKDDGYPGNNYFQLQADQNCGDSWDIYYSPNAETWRYGDREVICVRTSESAIAAASSSTTISKSPATPPGGGRATIAPTPSSASMETATAVPMATDPPQPTAIPWPIAGPYPTPAPPKSVSFSGGGLLKIDPGIPFAGQDIHFTLSGIAPHQNVAVTFIGPDGRERNWIYQGDYELDWTTAEFLQTDGSGAVRWKRYGSPTSVGTWKVRMEIDGASIQATYEVRQMPLQNLARKELGVPLRGYNGREAPVWFTRSVPSFFAAELQDHIVQVSRIWERRFGVRPQQRRDVYLMGSLDEFAAIRQVIGSDPGWEDGFYTAYGRNPGVYMMADGQLTDVREILAHEYVHGFIDELDGDAETPAWLEEGIADYFAAEAGLSEAGLSLEDPNPALARFLRQGDQVQAEAIAGTLFPLKLMEPRSRWSRRYDIADVYRQYRQSHMVVRYMVEKFGSESVLEIVRAMSRGQSIESATSEATSVSYQELETGFVAWLRTWDYPLRAQARPYLLLLEKLSAADREMIDERNLALAEWGANFDRAQAEQDWEELANKAADLLRRIEGARPPDFCGTSTAMRWPISTCGQNGWGWN